MWGLSHKARREREREREEETYLFFDIALQVRENVGIVRVESNQLLDGENLRWGRSSWHACLALLAAPTIHRLQNEMPHPRMIE